MQQKFLQFTPLIIMCTALLIPYNWWRIELFFNPINHDKLESSDVILYSTSWCTYCSKARRFLKSAEIPFIERDIEKSPRAYQQYQQLSGNGVPVIHIGPSIIQGYNQSAIRKAINTLVEARR